MKTSHIVLLSAGVAVLAIILLKKGVPSIAVKVGL